MSGPEARAEGITDSAVCLLAAPSLLSGWRKAGRQISRPDIGKKPDIYHAFTGRRRKIKCQFDTPEDAVCIGCKQRGTACRSQEYDDENAPEPGQKPDPPLARRLDRLEQMMERLVDKIVPDDMAVPGPSSSQSQEVRRSRSASSRGGAAHGRRESSVDMLEATVASEGPIAALLAMRHESVHRRGPSESGHIPTPALTSIESSTPTLPATATPQRSTSRPATNVDGQLFPPLSKHFWVCNALRGVIPPQPAVDAIVAASPGSPYIVALCYSEAERRDGKVEPTSSLASIPPVTAHPLILAKRALQVLICIQQLPPTFDWDALGTGAPMIETMARLARTSALVTTNDELIGYAEGIECLILQGYYQANCGSLRKAWITARQALSLAQIMGIDKGRSVAFRSCDSGPRPDPRTSADVLWYKVVYWERYLSLILGISVGSQGHVFGSDQVGELDSPIERLDKAHTVLSARISERNDSHHKDPARHQTNYALTQEIDLELEAASNTMPNGWWNEPRLDHFASLDSLWDATAKIISQIHHFTLILLLHVPYMLRDLSMPRYDYSKTTCVTGARELLSRFCSFRAHNMSAYSCRRVDYAGLIAAMTMCLSYLGKRRTEAWDKAKLGEDSELIEMTKRRMEHVARVNGDRLSREAVEIIEQLAPIIDRAAASLGDGAAGGSERRASEISSEVHFHIPYLGLINIKMPGTSAAISTQWHGHRRHPSSATGALERMAISPTIRQVETPQILPDVGFMKFAPYDHQAPFGSSTDLGVEPDFMAGSEDWALQGVDAAYWSLFEGIL